MKTTVKHLLVMLLAVVILIALAGCQQSVSENAPYSPETTETQTPNPSAAPNLPGTSSESDLEYNAVVPAVFESDIVLRVLRELTKPEYEGRVSGSEGIWQAALFLAEIFEYIGLTPWHGDSYIMTHSNLDMGSNHRLDFIIDFHGLRGSYSHNVIGIIPGHDRTRAVVVTAHYDAIGGGEGALDNASGVAAMLRIAKSLLFFGDKPETDIVFCAFDGEEVGLIGSRFFVPILVGQYSELYNINIDSVGMPGIDIALDISFWANERDSTLRGDFAEVLRSRGIPYIDIDGHLASNSDNIIFSYHEIPTLPIGLESEKIMEVIHSEQDVFYVLEISLIEELADAVTEFIINSQGKMY